MSSLARHAEAKAPRWLVAHNPGEGERAKTTGMSSQTAILPAKKLAPANSVHRQER